jgi:septum formation protein
MYEPLILASARPARKNLLVAAGLQVDVQPARVDEEAIKCVFKSDRQTAADCALAEA